MSNTYKNYTMLDYRVLVEIDMSEKKSAGGIIIADGDQKHQGEAGKELGILRAMGDRAFEEAGPTKPKVGDKVIFKRYAGILLKSNIELDQQLRMVNDNEIFAVFKD